MEEKEVNRLGKRYDEAATVEGLSVYWEDFVEQHRVNAATAANIFMNYSAQDRTRMVSHVIPVSGELQQGNGSLGTAGLGSIQDSPHSLKIKQEPFQLSPPSPLPPLHQVSSFMSDLQNGYMINASKDLESSVSTGINKSLTTHHPSLSLHHSHHSLHSPNSTISMHSTPSQQQQQQQQQRQR